MTHLQKFLAVLLLCAGSAQAEVVIDDFNGPGFTVNNVFPVPAVGSPQPLNDDLMGTISGVVTPGPVMSAPPTQFTTSGLGDFTINGPDPTSTLTLDYSFTSPLNIGNGLDFLVFDLFESVIGTWTGTFSINSGAQTTGPLAITSGNAVTFAPAVPVAVTDIQVNLAQTGAGGFIFNPSNGASIVANPEPASIALLGLTGLAGLVVRRRRNKAAKIA